MVKEISIIGAGNLTKSILSAIRIANNSCVINLIDIDKNKRLIAKKYNAIFSSTCSSIISKSDLVFLLVKPKEYKTVLNNIKKVISKKTILVSFMAGITHDQIKKSLDENITVVRCMTNLTASEIKPYIFYYSKSLDLKKTKMIKDFFSSYSIFKKCSTEADIDKLTALYGSGPAYYIYFNKIMRDSFIQMGYSKKLSKEYTDNLLHGTAKLIEGNTDLDKIINAIASKGGTTEAALNDFKKNKVNQLITKGICQAFKKSKNILKK
tara:strand:- start:6726 stop:7523 length:798 start_codon:yes stop_codon:yes gene_type:complete